MRSLSAIPPVLLSLGLFASIGSTDPKNPEATGSPGPNTPHETVTPEEDDLPLLEATQPTGATPFPSQWPTSLEDSDTPVSDTPTPAILANSPPSIPGSQDVTPTPFSASPTPFPDTQPTPDTKAENEFSFTNVYAADIEMGLERFYVINFSLGGGFKAYALLFVGPTGEMLLYDLGNCAVDAARILEVINRVNLLNDRGRVLDFLVVSHGHGDHDGQNTGCPAPDGNSYDLLTSSLSIAQQHDYEALSPGDELELTTGEDGIAARFHIWYDLRYGLGGSRGTCLYVSGDPLLGLYVEGIVDSRPRYD